jgi:hypothetical protein
MNLGLDDNVVAAAVAAAGTVIGALIQLRITWRKEVSERARGVPMTKKSRRGPVLAVGLLLSAAAVGGFAFSQYLMKQSDREAAALRDGELQAQLTQIRATAERLERVTLNDHSSSARTANGEGVSVTTTVEPCHARAGIVADETPACTEQDAVRITLCANLPASAVVTATVLYARPEDSPRPWSESRVAPGQDVGRARFADKPFERAETDQSKQVCTGFYTWDAEHAYSARLVAQYVLTAAVTDVPSAALVPVSGAGQ